MGRGHANTANQFLIWSTHFLKSDTLASTNKDDLNALLYIVVTLLFYSMGIIIGIITYLKREQAEMEEDKMFEMYLQLKREPFNLHKKERVQQMAVYLKQIEERREARERVENWRTAEGQQQQHLPSCRHHSPFLSGSEAWSGHAIVPPGVSDAEWVETGGGPALLCSLTLGVCEPLLTPETIKHVAFPDIPSTDIDARSVGIGYQGIPRCQCGSIKSAFKSSSPVKIMSAIKKTAISAQVVCPEQCKDCPDIFNNETTMNNDNSTPPPDSCDINKVDIQILDPALPVFQKCSLFINSPGLENKESFLSPRRRSMSFTATEIAREGIARKLSLDLQSTLTGHYGQLSPVRRNEAKSRSLQLPLLSPSPNEENLKKATFPNNDKLPCEQCAKHAATQNVSNDTLTESNADEGPLSPKDSQMAPAERARIRHMSPAPLLWPVEAAPKQQTIVYSIPLPEPKISPAEPPTPLPIQLALFLTPSQIDARPKIFPLTDIPKCVSLGESIDGATTEESSKRRLLNPKYDSWRRGQHKTVDIPDLSRSQHQDAPSKLAVHHGKRSLPRGHQPTRDNERRGALFFTQKALHKENDSPKQGAGAQRQARQVGLLGRQESVDSSNSRNSDLSDSPLLQPGGNDCAAVLNLSSASSAGSNSMSQLAPSKHQGKIPRLVRSQTEETWKLLKK
ncbi:hypothetical protein Btru_014237 [Bulinus truncatus]|nr:hypothetical protein Btru_014237 [Bulinus truncatus]